MMKKYLLAKELNETKKKNYHLLDVYFKVNTIYTLESSVNNHVNVFIKNFFKYRIIL